jgi:hypothetical protein
VNPTDPPEEVRRALEVRLLAYTRGIDRLDTDLIASAFHPGALMEGYGRPEPVRIEAFLERTVPRLRNHYRSTQHRVSNLTFTMLDAAVALESYVLAYHVTERDGAPDQLTTFSGRYLDRFTEVDHEWRIAHRELRTGWTQVTDLDQTMERDWLFDTRESDRD